jgi:hypothetical protein
MGRCKILVKNFERTLSNATTKLNLCFVRLMLKGAGRQPGSGGSPGARVDVLQCDRHESLHDVPML